MTARQWTRVPPEVRVAALSDYESGDTYTGIAKRYRLPVGTVQSIARSSKVYGKRPAGRSMVNQQSPASIAMDQEMAELRKNMTLEEIGQLYGMTRERVRQRLMRIGQSDSSLRMIECEECGEDVPYGSKTKHNSEHDKPEPLKKGLSIESELRDQAIVEAYQMGVRMRVISTTFTVSGGLPMTYGQIYYILRRNGIAPNRGGGKYIRDAEALARLSASQKGVVRGQGKKSMKGWRADAG